MVRYFNNCLVLICRAKKCRVLIRFRFLNNIPSFLLNMNSYIICVFLFIFSYFKGLKRGVLGRIQANGFAVRIMKVQTTIFNKNLTSLSWSPCTLNYDYIGDPNLLKLTRCLYHNLNSRKRQGYLGKNYCFNLSICYSLFILVNFLVMLPPEEASSR